MSVRPRHRGPRSSRVRTELVDILLNLRQAVLAGGAGLMLMTVVPAGLGWTTTVVVSGSMLPRIKPGDVVAAAPKDDAARNPVAEGTVVLVDNPVHPGELLLHRLVDYTPAGEMVLKGDANAARDSTPVPVGNLRGVARLKVPFVGLPYLWFQQGRYLPVIAAAVLLLALVLWRPSGHRAARHRAPNRPGRAPAVAGPPVEESSAPALNWRFSVRRDDDGEGTLVAVASRGDGSSPAEKDVPDGLGHRGRSDQA